MEEINLNYKLSDSIPVFSSKFKSSVNNILVIRPGALGDVIVTLPTLEAIRNHFRNAHIEVMGYSSILEILKGRFYADTIGRFDQADISHLFVENSSIPASLTKKLKGVDLIVSFLTDKEKVMVENLRAAGVRYVIHYDPFPSEGENVHIIDHLLKCLDLLGIPHSNKIPKIFLKDEDVLYGKNFVKNRIVVSGKKLVAVHPGSGSRQKCWTTNRYAELIMWLNEEIGVQVLLISGPADREVIEDLRGKIKDNFVLADQLPLPYLAAILKQCNLFVGNDSGITHMAAAVGIPTIAIFGPTDPQIWGPSGKRGRILYQKSPCSPCSSDIRRNCISQTCLENITAEAVIEEIRDFYQHNL
ncbi:MAG TPA: glycosyltransferase family 9 protein [Candidatus Wunengus sp. YC60]|uniref:glycosyltransferase family 9 protein n=1 Tax=Candidatus Wunengus sp. YC60 TaxID=3367697 RepID=UPI00402715EC